MTTAITIIIDCVWGLAKTHIARWLNNLLRQHINDSLTVIGTALASLVSAGVIPAEYGTLAAIGGGVGIAALLEKEWRKNRGAIIESVEDFIEDKTGLDVDADVIGDALDEVVDTVSEVVDDFMDDGDLDKSLSDVAEDLVEDIAEDLEESLKGMTVNTLRSMLSERKLDTKGKKIELVKRLLNYSE